RGRRGAHLLRDIDAEVERARLGVRGGEGDGAGAVGEDDVVVDAAGGDGRGGDRGLVAARDGDQRHRREGRRPGHAVAELGRGRAEAGDGDGDGGVRAYLCPALDAHLDNRAPRDGDGHGGLGGAAAFV